jgi:hypothetical protein
MELMRVVLKRSIMAMCLSLVDTATKKQYQIGLNNPFSIRINRFNPVKGYPLKGKGIRKGELNNVKHTGSMYQPERVIG